MDRLTKRDEYGNADIIGVDSGDLQCNLTFAEFNLVTEALSRLAAYEDTGLTPEEIQEAVDLFKDFRDADIPKELKSWVERCTWHVRKCDELRKALDKYEDAEAEGRLIVLPCKVGDTVYFITACSCEDIDGVYTKCEFYEHGQGDRFCKIPDDKECPYRYRIAESTAMEMNIFIVARNLGKTVFLTREEAEAALEGSEQDV